MIKTAIKHVNILDNLDKFPVIGKCFQKFWKSFQKFWKIFQKFFKTFQTIKNILSWKTAFKPTLIFHIVWQISYPLEKFQQILENFLDNLNLLFHEKTGFKHILVFYSLGKCYLTFQTIRFFLSWKTAFKYTLLF